MVATRVAELTCMFDTINLMDDKTLLTWLKEMFEACDDARIEVPDSDRIASKIGKARKLPPNPHVPSNPPQGDRVEWLLRESLGTLIANEVPQPGQVSLYGITALAIGSWLIGQR